MTARTTPAVWRPLCHLGRFEMLAFTRKYFQSRAIPAMPTPYAAEIRSEDGGVFILQFTSSESMELFVREMIPTSLEIHGGSGEDISALAETLQTSWALACCKVRETTGIVIAHAARQDGVNPWVQ